MNSTQYVKKELEKEQILLVVIPAETYHDSVLEIGRLVSKKKTCYVTLNKTCDALEEELPKNARKNVFYVDGISSSFHDVPKKRARVVHVSNPCALSEISILITKLLKKKFTYLVFDSISNVLIYQKSAKISQFISLLTNKVRQTKTRALIYIVDIAEQQTVLKECAMFVDKVVRL
ncbi:hypothetical protein COT72_02920 [archaeon CG10_big_fil_rev_8_21_14_0_10_43_11]|nr:MAG: hypothetical protein COT72_02920 [archaeon CG10_big_fil_rev_8_21_14_0_10_43_11]